MPFDMGFDFRGTAGFVTDPSYAVCVLTEAYPHTYTNGDGKSINAGWGGSSAANINRSSGNDPRIAGVDYNVNVGNAATFTVDLSSGSAPGAGTYTVDLAVGDAGGSHPAQNFKLLDTSTVLIDGTNGGAGISTASGEYIDATLALVSATTTWTGATVSKTFATTSAIFSMCLLSVADYSTVAHFRLTLAAVAALFPQRQILIGVGA